MAARFRDILGVPEVKGVTFFAPNGTVLFQEGVGTGVPLVDSEGAFPLLVAVLAGSPEADLAFSRGRVYARRTPTDSLVVVEAGPGAPLALLRLQVDLLLPSLPSGPSRRSLLGRLPGSA
jgi:hypothetical protein